MLSIQSISVFQYKNYLQQSWKFPERVMGISGKNGTGKTNLLDAIYFLCFTKSYFQRTDALLVHQGAQGLRVAGDFDKNGEAFSISAILRETGKKELRVNEQSCEKMADHIGNFPAVLIAPDDVQIITGGSEERRRFMDALFSQLDHDYLLQLIQYNRLLLQRNSLLKQMGESSQTNTDLLDVLDTQMLAPATYIFNKRTAYLKQLLTIVASRYANIAGQNYGLQVQYLSHLQEMPLEELQRRNRNADLRAQRTLQGIHRDDIVIRLNDQPFKQIASQGQRKSLLFALKLAEFDRLKTAKGFEPILLLDDVFEKLDEGRMQNLLYEVCVENKGQVLVTDTHPQRIRESFITLGQPYGLIQTSSNGKG